MRFEFIDRGQMETIHLATLDILENAGVTFLSERARKIFEGAGAIVDDKNKSVKIPQALVQELAQKVPKEFSLHGRAPKRTIQIGRDNQYLNCGGDYRYVLDLEDGRCRLALRSDVENLDQESRTDSWTLYGGKAHVRASQDKSLPIENQ